MNRNTFLAECFKGGPGLVAYAYRAAVYCPCCAERIARDIPAAELPESIDSPEFGDSEHVPQPVFFGESDTAQHCEECGEYLYGEEEESDSDSESDSEPGILAELRSLFGLESHEARFDVAEGLYWFAVHHHSGGGSPLYAIQCRASRLYMPGANESDLDPENEEQQETRYAAIEVYQWLVEDESRAVSLIDWLEAN